MPSRGMLLSPSRHRDAYETQPEPSHSAMDKHQLALERAFGWRDRVVDEGTRAPREMETSAKSGIDRGLLRHCDLRNIDRDGVTAEAEATVENGYAADEQQDDHDADPDQHPDADAAAWPVSNNCLSLNHGCAHDCLSLDRHLLHHPVIELDTNEWGAQWLLEAKNLPASPSVATAGTRRNPRHSRTRRPIIARTPANRLAVPCGSNLPPTGTARGLCSQPIILGRRRVG